MLQTVYLEGGKKGLEDFSELGEKIKSLKNAKNILHEEYTQTDFHKKKEENPDDMIPADPEDKEIYKLLTAIQQIDGFIKKYQDMQFELLKEQEK